MFYSKEVNDEKDYGIDQFRLPITKEDIKFNAIIGALMGLVFIGGLIFVSVL